MVRLSISVSLFLLAVVLAVPMEAEAVRPASLRKWEQLVTKRVDSFKSGRVLAEGIDDETAHIQDIKSYYRETLDSSDGWVEGTGIAKTELKMQSYEDEDLSAKSSFRQKTIDGRYIVYLAPRSTNQVLERMVRVLELATGATGQNLRADHIEQFRHVGKGFTATLNKNMVELVRFKKSLLVSSGSYTWLYDVCDYCVLSQACVTAYHANIRIPIRSFMCIVYMTQTRCLFVFPFPVLLISVFLCVSVH